MNGDDIRFIFGGVLAALTGWMGYQHKRVDSIQKETSKQSSKISAQHEKVNSIHDLLTEVRGDVKTIMRNGNHK